jgi:hypothetical protein
MIFIVSSVILLSFCTFRILEYFLGYLLEIVCMKILFCWCVGLILIYLGHLDCDLCFVILWNLLVFWPHSVFGQNHLSVKML